MHWEFINHKMEGEEFMRKLKKTKKLLPALLTSVLVLGSSTTALACTGVYVGSQVSENGSTYMGRSEDIGNLYGKVFSVAPARDIAENEVYKDTYGFTMDYSKFSYPDRTYSYTYVRDSVNYNETMKDANGNYIGEAYAEAGQNEKGLSMSATVSTNYNNDAKAADSLVRTGICEISMTSILLGGAATAREAVDLLAAIIDEYGAGECNSIMFSDPNETWYFEIVSGHQYAAVKMPADKVSVQPNIMLLDVIDVTDTENVVVSERLVSLAQENGFLETDENGNIHVAKTYSRENSGAGQYSRYWQGLFYVNPAAAAQLDVSNINNGINPLPLYINSVERLSTMDVLRLLAYRGEGSSMDSNANSGIYAIGNERQGECHIFETRQDMPDELSVIQWQAMADAEFSIYVPYYSALVTETNELYHTEALPRNYTDGSDTEGQINLNFHLINDLCYKNRANCADAVKSYFEAYQESLIAQQEEADQVMSLIYVHDKEAAKTAATETGKELAAQVSAASSAVLSELRAYLSGDMTEVFTLSEETKNMMPVYQVNEDLIPEHTMEIEFDADNHWNECSICGTVENAEGHTYENGICTVCQAKDPNYKPTNPSDNKPTIKPTTNNKPAPKTGDSSPLILFAALAAVCGSAITVTGKKKSN